MARRSKRSPKLLVARGVPVLLATGYEKAQLAPSLQHLPRVRKPYDEKELRGVLERALSLGARGSSSERLERPGGRPASFHGLRG